jgi:predicted dithiol-disulfide oxidoreductase (DUF899 family)
MNLPKTVSHEEWIEARKRLLSSEKALDRQRDALSVARRALPMEKVEKRYTFEGPALGDVPSKTSLSELFGKHSQLIVYHFMFDPSWDEGCKSCSFLADSFDMPSVHLAARGVSFAVVSRAELRKLAGFERRMGWKFPWYSSLGSEFNADYHVSFSAQDQAAGRVQYNYKLQSFPSTEAPGASVFMRVGDDVFHTYSTYSRGLDHLINTYNFLDLTPLGRQEEGLSHGMSWVRHRDDYP